MSYCKLFQSDERLQITIPTDQAIRILQDLQKANLREANARPYLDQETIIQILLGQPRLFTIQKIVSQPAILEDDIDYLETDGAIDTIRELGQQLVSIGFVLSLLRRKAAPAPVESDPLADFLPEMPSPVEHIGPMLFRMNPGTPTPSGASPSDPLTSTEATNLYNFIIGAQETVTRERERLGMPTTTTAEKAVNELLRSRSLFLLRLRGHHFRERLPLGHNCCPRSPHLEYIGILGKLHVELVKKNITRFFRYPILFAGFSKFFEKKLTELANDKSRGQASLDQKIRILSIGVSTGEEPISIVLTAAICLEKQRQKLTNILGKDPGQISDWLEVIGTEKKARYYEDIEQFLALSRYSQEFIDEIPTEYLEPARRHGFIIEQADTFHFSPAIMAPIQIVFLNFFELGSLEHPIFENPYDAMFYIKVLEYLITDPQNLSEAEAGQLFLQAFDSGALLNPGGYFFTDGNSIRLAWTAMSQNMSAQTTGRAFLRRALPESERFFGPKITDSLDPIELINQGEISLPMTAGPLLSKSFRDVMTNYPMDEVAIFCFSGKTSTEVDFVAETIRRLEKRKKAINKRLGRGISLGPRQALETQLQQIEAELRTSRQELKQLTQTKGV